MRSGGAAELPVSSWHERLGLARNPFKDTLDVDLFFRTRQHEEALVKTRIGIDDGHALILLAGPSGTGKTMVSQVLLRGLDRTGLRPAIVFVHPGMGKGALLAAILAELEAGPPARLAHERVAQVRERAVALHEEGKRLLVLIDEAHFLKAEALHLLRTLANLETEDEKLVTVLMLAEDSLRRRLDHPSYAALRGRITFSVALRPLSAEETEQYVKFRLLKCGASPALAHPEIYGLVHRVAGGIPREINKLLYNSLVEAMTAGSRAITPEAVLLAAQKLVNVQQYPICTRSGRLA